MFVDPGEFDGGDCMEFNKMYPDCLVPKPYWVGNGHCDGSDYDSEACGFDGGDYHETQNEG